MKCGTTAHNKRYTLRRHTAARVTKHSQSALSSLWCFVPLHLMRWSLLRKALIRAGKPSFTTKTLCEIALVLVGKY